ncbi:MAG: rod shape-determining protein MreD [Chlamydiia bacterium]
MRQKLLFLLLGSLASIAWATSLAWSSSPPQYLIVVCALGLLRLSRSASVGGACLAGLVWDALDWQVRLGSHAVTLGLACFCLHGLQRRFDVARLFSLPTITLILAWSTALLQPLVMGLFGCSVEFPGGWWGLCLGKHPVELCLASMALLPWRQAWMKSSGGDEDHLKLPPLLELARGGRGERRPGWR